MSGRRNSRRPRSPTSALPHVARSCVQLHDDERVEIGRREVGELLGRGEVRVDVRRRHERRGRRRCRTESRPGDSRREIPPPDRPAARVAHATSATEFWPPKPSAALDGARGSVIHCCSFEHELVEMLARADRERAGPQLRRRVVGQRETTAGDRRRPSC